MRLVAGLAEPLEVALDTAGDHVQVYPTAADLVESGGHLTEQSGRYEARPDRDEKLDPTGNRRERGYCRPGLGERRGLLEKPVGEPGGYEKRVEPVALGGLYHLPQVVERRRTLGAKGADVAAVAVDWYEPVESGVGSVVWVRHRTSG